MIERFAERVFRNEVDEYDSIDVVCVEGEEGSFTVSKKLYVSDCDDILKFVFPNGWVNKGKLAIIKIDNHIGRDCSINIKVTYIKSDGSEVRKTEKQFLGFSKDDSNYFFFQPEVDFDDINYEIKTVKDDTPGRSGYFTFGTVATAEPRKTNELDTFELELLGHAAKLSSSMDCSSTEKLYASTEMLYFDNKGNPICISTRAGESKGVLSTLAPDICVEQNGEYVLPDNMKGELRCVVSIIETMDEEQWAKKITGG
jgi:hypothetical protein